MPTTPEHTDPHGECAAEIARLREALSHARSNLRAIETWPAANMAKDVPDRSPPGALLGDIAAWAGASISAIDRALSHPALEGKT